MSEHRLFERHQGGERAILVHIDFPDTSLQGDLIEFKELVVSAGIQIIDTITGTRKIPDSKYFIGSGKAEEVKALIEEHNVDVILFDHTLSPAQEKNLEMLLKCRVVDRNGIILDIFAQRARSFEGKLQVELAQLNHISTRLIRGWTHLERQKGGIGLRGPGETQLETDRRLIRNRMKSIRMRLEKTREQREQNRQARHKQATSTVSLVGYTNAGKSSLFNTLTGEEVYAADQLFATLDPTMRKLSLPGCQDAILVDTVGFIRHLPHDLIESFKATLEETREADLLLHVIDIADPNWQETAEVVRQVLKEIGADHVPIIEVFNKIDLLTHRPDWSQDTQETESPRVWVSALTQEGLAELKKAISIKLYGPFIHTQVALKPEAGQLRAELYELDAIIDEYMDEEGNNWITIRMSQRDYNRLFVPHR
jgi:GTP-binding protein HflX